MISLALALLASSGAPQPAADHSPSAAASTPTPNAARSPAADAARQWLDLVDAFRWQESWAATAQSFRSLNSAEVWRSVSEDVRVPLGRVVSRTFVSGESIPAPPAGLQLVRFRTDFEHRAGATETLSLVREGESWRVVGYFIE